MKTADTRVFLRISVIAWAVAAAGACQSDPEEADVGAGAGGAERDASPSDGAAGAEGDASPSGGAGGAGGDACGPIDRLFPGPCEQSWQPAGEAAQPRHRYSYDAAGRLTRDLDYTQDGRPDHDQRWRYDAAGNLVEQREHSGDRLLTAMICTHTYEDTRLVLSECDGGPGGPDGVLEERVRRTYDAQGRLSTIEADGEPPFEPPDGTPDSLTSFTYDAAGNELTEAQDFDADEDTDRLITQSWDERGNRLSEAWDLDVDGHGPDGQPNRLTVWTYDAADHVLSERRDDDGDGIWDTEHENTWGEDGRQLTAHARYLGAFGAPYDVDTVYTYDASGRLERVTTTWSDGSSIVSVYTYDEAGRLRRRRSDARGSMGGDLDMVPTTSTETFDCAGNRVREDTDLEQDGTVEDSTLYSYDDACWPAESL